MSHAPNPAARRHRKLPIRMPEGQRRIGDKAFCEISTTTAVPIHLRARVRDLRNVWVNPTDRRNGFAGRLMAAVCSEADALLTVLILTVKPYDATPADPDATMLEAFYAKFGFIPIQRDPTVMARQPQPIPPLDVPSPLQAGIAEAFADG